MHVRSRHGCFVRDRKAGLKICESRTSRQSIDIEAVCSVAVLTEYDSIPRITGTGAIGWSEAGILRRGVVAAYVCPNAGVVCVGRIGGYESGLFRFASGAGPHKLVAATPRLRDFLPVTAAGHENVVSRKHRLIFLPCQDDTATQAGAHTGGKIIRPGLTENIGWGGVVVTTFRHWHDDQIDHLAPARVVGESSIEAAPVAGADIGATRCLCSGVNRIPE
jgi:hypothetical protein